jgi:hypothetical protein
LSRRTTPSIVFDRTSVCFSASSCGTSRRELILVLFLVGLPRMYGMGQGVPQDYVTAFARETSATSGNGRITTPTSRASRACCVT